MIQLYRKTHKSLSISFMLNRYSNVKATPLRSLKEPKKSENQHKNKFLDTIEVKIKAGNGGDGSISLSHLRKKEFAGPDGGDGGNGGHVLFQATPNINSLSHIRKVENGYPGIEGRDSDRIGKCGEHRVISVPVGTIFRDADSRKIIAELTVEGSLFLAAKGGAGGRGNAYFKNSENQTPMLAEQGGFGEEIHLLIELNSMAQVGLIGLPNAGKSTILRAISRARPRVAAYPFTTLIPHIGMVQYDDNLQISVADIPGIIKDAHKDKGLGIKFLRHIERCKCLLYIIDLSRDSAFADLQELRYEIRQYCPDLLDKISAIVANKMDMPSSGDNALNFIEAVRTEFSDIDSEVPPVFYVSGKFGNNIHSLLMFIRKVYDGK